MLGWLSLAVLLASEYRGRITFSSLPVPGATVTATQGSKKFTAITDLDGVYSFPTLSDGTWTIEVEMSGFASIKQSIQIPPHGPTPVSELQMLPLEDISAQNTRASSNEPKTQSAETPSQNSDDGFLINGSVNNGAASPFAQFPAFGNNRRGGKGLYTGGIGMTLDNAALDAQPFSITGQNMPKPAYSRLTGMAVLGGPLKIPHLMPNGPNFFAGYQWTRNRNVTTTPGLMPTLTERSGNFSQLATPVIDPTTGAPFPGNLIPQNRISPQASALLNLYPLPNFSSTRYNYQIPLISPTHQDALESRFNKAFNFKDQIYGGFAFQSTRMDSPNLFDFVDTTDLLGVNTNVNWSHRIRPRLFMNLGYEFSRLSTRVKPYFENRENVSGNAGISGNNQDAVNWGPPGLTFSSGISALSDGLPSSNHNQTGALSYAMLWSHNGHNVTFGGDYRRQQFNYLSQQNPRGGFTFTGAAAGSDFGGFLLGIPDTSAIAFGNADKYFRDSLYDAYVSDDWRISPEFTLNVGMRWEYGSPITELYGRLVNLDVIPGFSAVAPVVASDPDGPLTGQRYPSSLIRPNKSAFDPRVGIAWRPLAGSSMVVRAGYGIYYDTSVYQTIATQMAQQPPLSKAFNVANSAANPLTLANGFNASPDITPNTFAIDPNFRIGYAQEWQASVQRDLPGSLQMTATYLGIKGTRGAQEFLPNTYPAGAANPCPVCPTGFAYMASNGNSTRHAAELQLRRRLHNGLTATVQYAFSKSIDNVAVLGGQGAYGASQKSTPYMVVSNSPGSGGGGSGSTTGSSSTTAAATSPSSLAIAQNWLNLSAERSLSNFDQRHLISGQLQYTTGMGIRGGTLLTGWKGALLKEWTFATDITVGTGLPLTRSIPRPLWEPA